MSRPLILTDETLRVATAVLPYGQEAAQLAAARDPSGGGYLTVYQVREVLRRLSEAAAYRRRLVTDEALVDAIEQWRHAMRDLDYAVGGELAIHVWDVLRDGLPPRMAPPEVNVTS